MTDPAGRNANKNGSDLESTVKTILEINEYQMLTAAEKKLMVRNEIADLEFPYARWYAEQVRKFRNIYGARWVADFVIFDKNRFPDGLLIETKWQGVTGSVDEKYVFTVMSLKAVPIDTILVLDGGGARAGAVEWIKSQQKPPGFTFKTLTGFMSWARSALK